MNIVGPRGSVHPIIKKVPVTSDYGFNIFSGGSISHDYVEASKQVWKCLEFRLEDVYGNVIDLNDSPVSFSIVLSTILEDLLRIRCNLLSLINALNGIKKNLKNI